ARLSLGLLISSLCSRLNKVFNGLPIAVSFQKIDFKGNHFYARESTERLLQKYNNCYKKPAIKSSMVGTRFQV
ncbi:TPA: hypothetical protein ACH9PH_005580, partial [Escherichia coli]